MRALCIGFILGAMLSAGTAWALKEVEVTFYPSSIGSKWCYLHESNRWVECIGSPCAP